MAIFELLGEYGYARVTDVGTRMGLTRGSASVGLQSLRHAGYLRQDENHFFHLTPRGALAVKGLRARHRVVELFLTDVLGLSQERAHRESCRVENLIEGPTARRMQALVDYWRDNVSSDELESRLGVSCPACDQDDSKRCPCCGLECLNGQCSLLPGDADVDGAERIDE